MDSARESEHLASGDPPNRGGLPSFVIIGAMRAGTTSMAAYLRQHSDVFIAPRKEVHFFDAYFDRGLDWYRAQFAGARDGQVIGEATPRYLYVPDAIDRMAATLPDARLIAILRNPVDRAYSHYWDTRAKGRETLEFAEAIERENERQRPSDAGRYAYLDRGRYLEQLKRVTDRYPREALLVLIFEEMIRSPRETFGETCRHVGVTDDVVPDQLGRAVNAYRPSAPRLRSRMFRPLARRHGRKGATPSSYPAMDHALRAELLERFAGDNAALAAWLGRDLNTWSS